MSIKLSKVYRQDLSNISSKAVIGDDCVIHSHVSIHDRVKIGKRCKIQAGAFLCNGVELEDDVFIGPHVCFTNDPKLDGSNDYETQTIVKSGAKIGANATIRAGIVIGKNVIIGCGSVVLDTIPDGAVVVGNPAHQI